VLKRLGGRFKKLVEKVEQDLEENENIQNINIVRENNEIVYDISIIDRLEEFADSLIGIFSMKQLEYKMLQKEYLSSEKEERKNDLVYIHNEPVYYQLIENT
jgi:hypothetical protein